MTDNMGDPVKLKHLAQAGYLGPEAREQAREDSLNLMKCAGTADVMTDEQAKLTSVEARALMNLLDCFGGEDIMDMTDDELRSLRARLNMDDGVLLTHNTSARLAEAAAYAAIVGPPLVMCLHLEEDGVVVRANISSLHYTQTVSWLELDTCLLNPVLWACKMVVQDLTRAAKLAGDEIQRRHDVV